MTCFEFLNISFSYYVIKFLANTHCYAKHRLLYLVFLDTGMLVSLPSFSNSFTSNLPVCENPGLTRIVVGEQHGYTGSQVTPISNQLVSSCWSKLDSAGSEIKSTTFNEFNIFNVPIEMLN